MPCPDRAFLHPDAYLPAQSESGASDGVRPDEAADAQRENQQHLAAADAGKSAGQEQDVQALADLAADA